MFSQPQNPRTSQDPDLVQPTGAMFSTGETSQGTGNSLLFQGSWAHCWTAVILEISPYVISASWGPQGIKDGYPALSSFLSRLNGPSSLILKPVPMLLLWCNYLFYNFLEITRFGGTGNEFPWAALFLPRASIERGRKALRKNETYVTNSCVQGDKVTLKSKETLPIARGVPGVSMQLWALITWEVYAKILPQNTTGNLNYLNFYYTYYIL